ncbi:MAG: MBL fold metallo-hydrolase [Alphaproteobacteria bacterium]|nr:MBL fold metallo-hydrolase [Alphaproteobacteria bacterium]
MIVQKIESTDIFRANTYFYVDEKTKHGFIIDPCAGADVLINLIMQKGWTIEKMLLTHSHLDHIGAVLSLYKKLQIPFFGSNASQQYLSENNLQAHFTDFEVLKNMCCFNDGDDIALFANKSVSLKVISTPGHTLDSVVFYDAQNGFAFTGDTIFQSSIGRTDIQGSGGNAALLMKNITQKILTLPENTVLYPGHGESTTVLAEKQFFGVLF